MIEDNPEPDSPESQTIDVFFQAVAAGKGTHAANALRSLESLDGFSLECLADLLDNLPLYGGLFPRQLKLKKLGRGRPKNNPDASKLKHLGLGRATAFFQGIAAGNAPEAAKALRSLKSLQGTRLNLLADLFDAKAFSPKGFYWRLKLTAPHAGTTRDRLTTVEKDFGWNLVLREALAAHPGAKKEAIIHEVMTRARKPRTTVTDRMKRHGIPAPTKSK